MRVSYVEGLASYTGPESCGGLRKGSVEALTGVRAGRVPALLRKPGHGPKFQAKLINHTDAFVIVLRGQAAEALQWKRQVTTGLKLTPNESKTCVRNARSESTDFPGYSFGPLCVKPKRTWNLSACPSDKSVSRGTPRNAFPHATLRFAIFSLFFLPVALLFPCSLPQCGVNLSCSIKGLIVGQRTGR